MATDRRPKLAAAVISPQAPPEPTWQERAVVTVGGWLDAGVAALPEWVRW